MSGTKHWIDWRGLSDRRKAERLYPDLARVGSLARLLDDELAKIGSALRSSSAIYGFDSWSYAEVTLAKREANIYIAKRSRDFGLEVWEHGILMANGSTPELSDVAAAIPLVLESTTRKISRLAREIGFLKFKRSARKHERGTYIEKRWQRMLRSEGWSRSGNEIFHWDDLGELIERAAERPELRRLLPYTSLHRFSVTPKAQVPDKSVPVIWPLGNRLYALSSDTDGELFAKGGASVVLDALVEHTAGLENPRWPAG